MQLATAIAQLQKEQEFLGIGLLELLADIHKNGSAVYCERTMVAFRVFMAEGQKMFAPA